MKVWYDACTGKHVRYGVAIAKRLRSMGHTVILSTRRHPDTLTLSRFLGESFRIIGSYDPQSLISRTAAGAKRQLLFCKLFKTEKPDLAISHCSVDQSRVAFGLHIPLILTVDTPYADAVNKLTLPLCNYAVASRGIPEAFLQKYLVDGKLVGFDGVDEAAWIKNATHRVEYNFGKPLIVVREPEEKAVYANVKVDMATLSKKLTNLGKVVFLSRYERKTCEGLIVPKGFIDTASLVAQADLFVGVGGTITREAALQGTPAIVIKMFQDQFVNDFLIKKGFPIYNVEYSETPKFAEKLMGHKCDVKNLLGKLDDPVDAIVDLIEEVKVDK